VEPVVRLAAPRRVLVADDNHDAADSLAMMLAMRGHQTRTAYDGEAALAVAAEFRPDVAIVDIGMPKLDGYEVARRLRADGHGAELRLIALTGWGHDRDRRRAREAGFDAHLVKPVEPTVLEEALEAGVP
jgi:CheY-like chemotaxis protein